MATLLLHAAVSAQAASVPDGLKLGPWIFSPQVASNYEYVSNVFLEAEEQSEDDRVFELYGMLEASLPFRNSMLELSYESSDLSFEESEFPKPRVQEGSVELELNFKTGDRLVLRDLYRQDFARSDEAPGDEEVFEGVPYNFNRADIEFSRDERGQQGYLIRIRRQDFIYDEGADCLEENNCLGLFEYRGFDNTFEYRQPLPNYRFWTVGYRSKRYNHYDPRQEDAPQGVAFRKEETDAVTVGFRGYWGEDQPYQIRLGYSRFRYKGQGTESEGIVGRADWRVIIGGRTDLRLQAVRQPLASNFDTFYINNLVRGELERSWRHFDAGAELRLVKNDYEGVVATASCKTGPNTFKSRKDFTWEVGAGLRWKVHERFAFSLDSYHESRSSSCDGFEYDATGVEVGILLGWF